MSILGDTIDRALFGKKVTAKCGWCGKEFHDVPELCASKYSPCAVCEDRLEQQSWEQRFRASAKAAERQARLDALIERIPELIELLNQ